MFQPDGCYARSGGKLRLTFGQIIIRNLLLAAIHILEVHVHGGVFEIARIRHAADRGRQVDFIDDRAPWSRTARASEPDALGERLQQRTFDMMLVCEDIGADFSHSFRKMPEKIGSVLGGTLEIDKIGMMAERLGGVIY